MDGASFKVHLSQQETHHVPEPPPLYEKVLISFTYMCYSQSTYQIFF